jgi:hypothetical protein
MFERFFAVKLESPNNAEVLFFDESIIAKKKRSKMTVLKQSTPFLENKSDEITDTYTPPPPSNGGLPEGKSYIYSPFPRLNPDLYGKIRPKQFKNKIPPLIYVQQSPNLCSTQSYARTENTKKSSMLNGLFTPWLIVMLLSRRKTKKRP